MNRTHRLSLRRLCQGLAAVIAIQAFAASDDVLKPGDRILVTVYEQDDLTTETQISDSGEIEFPLIGTVNLGGKTVKEAAAELTDRLSKGFVVDPKVTLTITGVGVDQAIVVGMVHRPGAVDFPAKRKLDVLSAIAMAGGFSPGADLNGVVIRRESEVIRVDSGKLTGQDPAQIPLEPDDIVSVGQVFAQHITVMGQVSRPGFVEVPTTGDLNLLSAIALAGGYTDEAAPTDVVIRRGDAVHRVDADALASRAGAGPFFARAGDVITVGREPVVTFTIMGEVAKPSVFPIPAGETLTLLEAIAIAGGYTDNANPKRIVVRRAAGEGESKDKFYRIDGKRLAGDAAAKPFLLRPGDTITVPERFF